MDRSLEAEANKHGSSRLKQGGIAVVVAGLVIAAAGVTMIIMSASTVPASANNSTLPGYYENETVSGPNSSNWFGSGNATLDQLIDMGMRLPGYIIGTGGSDPSGTGYVGLLLTGLLMAGSAVGVIMGIGVGPVGGAIAALSVGFGLSRVGLAPAWVRIIMLFALGLIAAIAMRRSIQR